MHKHANWHPFKFWNLLGMCVPLSSFKGIMKSEKELGQVYSFPLPVSIPYCPLVSVNPCLSSSSNHPISLTCPIICSTSPFLPSFLLFFHPHLHTASSSPLLIFSLQSSPPLFFFLSLPLHHPSLSPPLLISCCMYSVLFSFLSFPSLSLFHLLLSFTMHKLVN